MDDTDDRGHWPLRAWLLLALGGAIGLAVHFLVAEKSDWDFTDDPYRLAAATFLFVGGVALAFTLERLRWWWSVVFALVAGFVVASVLLWNGGPESWNAADGWRFACAGLAVAIAAPLFQAARDEGRAALPYVRVHDHAWTNVIIWFAAWAFVLIVWLLAWLLGALFDLIGIDLIERALRAGWFGRLLTGAAFGAGVGLLRERDRIVSTLQRVVTAVLGVLAPVLGAGLVIFLVSLPFTGLAPLWEATKSTTPILLSCVIGALILANAVIGDTAEDEAKLPPIRYAAMALATTVLPLAAIAAVSVGLRTGQYGLTPSRLWAIVFVGIAIAYGLAYLYALVRRRRDWALSARPLNMKLALGLCALAFLLSTPLISFGAISTRDQIARLESGRTPQGKFDWQALAFDFGPSGRRALERLAKSGSSPALRVKAKTVLAAKGRYELYEVEKKDERSQAFVANALVLPRGATLPPELIAAIPAYHDCAASPGNARCVVKIEPDGEAVIASWSRNCEGCPIRIELWRRAASGKWGTADTSADDGFAGESDRKAAAIAQRKAAESGAIEVRDVTRRQVFIGGKPVDTVFR